MQVNTHRWRSMEVSWFNVPLLSIVRLSLCRWDLFVAGLHPRFLRSSHRWTEALRSIANSKGKAQHDESLRRTLLVMLNELTLHWIHPLDPTGWTRIHWLHWSITCSVLESSCSTLARRWVLGEHWIGLSQSLCCFLQNGRRRRSRLPLR